MKELIKEYVKDFDTANRFGVSSSLKQRVDDKSIHAKGNSVLLLEINSIAVE